MTTEIREYDPNYSTENAVYFYTPRYYAFDNFSAFSIHIWGTNFPTVEHAYQWKKYETAEPTLADEILNATSAYMTKKISDANKDKFAPNWHTQKEAIMEELIRAKTAQHEIVRSLLLETEGKEIIENSPTDYFWGIGADGTGENIMGKIWMKLRDELTSKH